MEQDGVVEPDYIRTKLLKEINQMGDTISVSRPAERLQWGIAVPDDD